jgi:para-aminobenzoate synthetase
MPPLKTLLLDNYDSFTFNLHQAIAQVSGTEPRVIRNDQVEWDEVCSMNFDVVVISPGPGRPENRRDFGVCAAVIRQIDLPLLGVCLGHQGIAHCFGGSVIHAPQPIHGQTSPIYHSGTGIFEGIAQGFDAVRYHSLMVAEPLPDCLERTAWTEDGLIMGLRHRSRPVWGVQFHPESVCTPDGLTILGNFFRLSARLRGKDCVPRTGRDRSRDRRPIRLGASRQVFVKVLSGFVEPTIAYRHFFSKCAYSFWLDNATATGWNGRFSFMGGALSETAEVVRYFVSDQRIVIERGGEVEAFTGDLFEYLKRTLLEREVATPGLPFDFNCGYVGYFGYELKASCGANAAHIAADPDCTLLFADRQIVIDNLAHKIYLLWYGSAADKKEADLWWSEVALDLSQAANRPAERGTPGVSMSFTAVQPEEVYLESIRKCIAYITNGESYEICLTNKLRAPCSLDPLEYYETLRKLNPAPYSAFLRFGRLSVACSSPERFLRIGQDRWVETKPIKGTAPRGFSYAEDERLRAALSRDVKTKAEHLMIVDLLRNDLGSVCEIGTVHVPKFMDVETYSTVHQLVSTIRGRLRPSFTSVDCLRTTFPGGSMTGAPKLRTLEILDGLETEARGVYSGCIGFLALNGSAELNIVIRTAVFSDGEVSIGTGGAIVALSDPRDEWDEVTLKAQALVKAFDGL